MKLKNKSAIITGASQGLGFAIAEAFITEGANVMLCARDADKLFDAQRMLSTVASEGVKVLAMPANVTHVKQINELVTTAFDQFQALDILVANAGVYGTKGPVDEVDWEAWCEAIDINLKGTVLPCRTVLPYFKKQRHGKIIILSGGGATKPMPHLSAYATSKAGVVRFTETLAEEVKAFNIDVNAVAPGALNTRMLDEILAAGPEKVGKKYFEQALQQKASGGAPLSKGAALCTFLASGESDGITGKLLSAVWDPWKSLPDYLNQLRDSDIYTLRRIVPQDRDQDWGEIA